MVVVVSAVAVFTWWLPAHRLDAARESWQPPPQAMLSSSMREEPVPGWRTTVSDLGLPAVGDSRIAVSNDPRGPRPFIGSIDSRAYLLASSGAPETPQWWLVGVDVTNGRPLFEAVPLSVAARNPECFLNGPNDILCLDGLPSVTARVIDGRSGAVDYVGPSDLRLGFGTLAVKQVGVYAVATTQDQGVFGIGRRAETTWFVPGDGLLAVEPGERPAARSQTLTAQGDSNPKKFEKTVFSVADGRVVQPEIEEDASIVETSFYSGGFAGKIAGADGAPGDIYFFDGSGKRVGGSAEGSLREEAADLPVTTTESDDANAVYSAEGKKLIEVPTGVTQLVGTTLMVNMAKSQAFPRWQQYNLKDGAEGPACDYPAQNLLGTEGTTLVFGVTSPNSDVLAKAYDLYSCERLWSIPKQAGSVGRIWRIGSHLVQLTSRATELTSLVGTS
ncbi:MAG: hypothetical protein AB1925_22320 [Actinomycetota bacterium]